MFDSADTLFTRGMLIPLDGDADVVNFQWNPKAVIQDKKIRWNHLKVAGREQPFQQYGCGEARIFIFPFSVSNSNNGANFVKTVQEALLKYTKPTAGGTVKRPPIAQLILGMYLNIRCVVRDIKVQNEEFFNPYTLLPSSAEIVVTVEEYMPDE
jgi:hypothetical protein